MSHPIDSTYDVYAASRARNTGARLRSRTMTMMKLCSRCQAIHKHLRLVGEGDTWPDEELDCGETYRDHWGKEPPEHIAALAFWRPGDPLPSERGRE